MVRWKIKMHHLAVITSVWLNTGWDLYMLGGFPVIGLSALEWKNVQTGQIVLPPDLVKSYRHAVHASLTASFVFWATQRHLEQEIPLWNRWSHFWVCNLSRNLCGFWNMLVAFSLCDEKWSWRFRWTSITEMNKHSERKGKYRKF